MAKKIVIFDYGFGNVRSAMRAFEHVGATVELTNDYQAAITASGLVVPGVGAFNACIEGFRGAQGQEVLLQRLRQEAPVFGICVGHQILFERSEEGEVSPLGIGLIPGVVERLRASVVPHMGWNEVDVPPGALAPAPLRGLLGERFYFVHSYGVLGAPTWHGNSATAAAASAAATAAAAQDAPGVATTTHEQCEFISAIQQGALFGTQFHPEKSGQAGLALIKNWLDDLS
jgi:glutamine amidotransferase